MRINISDIFKTGEILETAICDIPLSDKIFINKDKAKISVTVTDIRYL
jgi:hypothetical protein